MKRIRHTTEQVVRKLSDADRLLAEDMPLAEASPPARSTASSRGQGCASSCAPRSGRSQGPCDPHRPPRRLVERLGRTCTTSVSDSSSKPTSSITVCLSTPRIFRHTSAPNNADHLLQISKHRTVRNLASSRRCLCQSLTGSPADEAGEPYFHKDGDCEHATGTERATRFPHRQGTHREILRLSTGNRR